MSIARLSREKKRQLGQYLTPRSVAEAIVNRIEVLPAHKVLEPSFGEGVFILELLDVLGRALDTDALRDWASSSVFGCEVDGAAYQKFCDEWTTLGLGPIPGAMEKCDFFRWGPPGADRDAMVDPRRYFSSRLECLDLVIGNPPFGGSIDPAIQDELDAILGFRMGMKIKKETYAFFIVKALDLLKPGGLLCFICSDTLLTINTMRGLRNLLQSTCDVEVSEVPGRFSETNQDMILLRARKTGYKPQSVRVLGKEVEIAHVEATGNLSWRSNGEWARYFEGSVLGDVMVATSGMTIGNNELFLRRIVDHQIEEWYEFAYVQEPITLAKETGAARLGKLPEKERRRLREMERSGATREVVTWERGSSPRLIRLPDQDYRPYNKANSYCVYHEPEWAVFWRNDGGYVYTFKKTGNWYLRGVGGKPFFGREGITWSLIAPRFYTKYLPPGYILDSGAPCAFLREGVPEDELFFILAWTLTSLCNAILKNVINHTRNIQSKDFERLPYPFWVRPDRREEAVQSIKSALAEAVAGREFRVDSPEVLQLESFFEYEPCVRPYGKAGRTKNRQLTIPF